MNCTTSQPSYWSTVRPDRPSLSLLTSRQARPAPPSPSEAETQGGGQPVAKEGCVERNGLVPGVEADADLALGIVQAASNEGAVGGQQVDLVAIGGIALDGRDGAGKDPGMASIEGPGRWGWSRTRAAPLEGSLPSGSTATRRAARRKPAGTSRYRRAYAAPLAWLRST